MDIIRDIRFSIITPVYNREDCIGRCIDSVIKQNYDNLEMWIIDDGSTDQTPSIIQEYKKKYNFIKFHRFDKNKGVNAARNYGIQNCNSDFTILLDSDDCFTTNALEIISSTINKHSKYKHFLFAQDDRVVYYKQNPYLSNDICDVFFSDFLLEKVAGDFTHVINTNTLKKYPFREDLRTYEGLNFFRIYKDSNVLLFCNKVVVNRERERSDSVTLEYKLTNIETIKKRVSALETQLELFENDYRKYDKDGYTVEKLIKETYLFSLSLGRYDLSFLELYLQEWNKKVPSIYRLIRSCKLGKPLRLSIYLVSRSKSLIS